MQDFPGDEVVRVQGLFKFSSFRNIYYLVIIPFLVFFFFSQVFAADTTTPKRLTNAQPGDCAACHAGGKQILPSNHVSTKSMKLKQCLTCHSQDKDSITFKMPTSHAHTLSDVSCQKCHGNETPNADVYMDTCTSCHSIETLASAKVKDAAFYPNPHNSHYGTDVECTLCHHQHTKSEYMCTQCHSFKNVTPSPMLPLTFATQTKIQTTTAPATTQKATTTQKTTTAAASTKSTAPALTCKSCHSEAQYEKNFDQTKHGYLTCTTCHVGITDFTKHMHGEQAPKAVNCLACHEAVTKEGFHTTVKKFDCLQCHTDIHPKDAPATKTAVAEAAASSAAISITDCTTCHSDPKYVQHFAQTPHAALGCTTCHKGITDLALHMEKKQVTTLSSCATCHRDVEKDYEKSSHAVVAKLSCIQCHPDIHPEQAPAVENNKKTAERNCTQCHNDLDMYENKGHGAKLIAGNMNAAGCTDCHGVHNTPVFSTTDKGISDKRAYYTNLCVSCHGENGTARRYGVFPLAVKTYGETYHGKVRQLGHLEEVAGCADCHPGHNILLPTDPLSALTPQALIKTCGECHKNFHPRFVSYVPHPDPDDPKRFFSLYVTKIFMIALLVGVFAFFWVHILLWWRKAYAEKSSLVRAGLKRITEIPGEEGRQYVRRFSMRDRIMHLVLILSFFGVVLSGFPLKYPAAAWSKYLISLLGGVESAGLIHRFSAGIMWLLFLYVCWLSVKFLFPGGKIKGWVGRLFNSDSLFPRLKDLQDCWGMFKWFVNRGERPKFDRWTYWEKFDFLAVFWGMFVIGLSGLIMWLPELSSYIIPGWMINISHLAHSEEAFLAAVFIFTIHFFNNHLVPDKFPLEPNIFTGIYTLDALKHERPLEYERILKENRLEEIKCSGPSTSAQLFAGLFGIACVLLGLLLTVLIFWAVLAG